MLHCDKHHIDYFNHLFTCVPHLGVIIIRINTLVGGNRIFNLENGNSFIVNFTI